MQIFVSRYFVNSSMGPLIILMLLKDSVIATPTLDRRQIPFTPRNVGGRSVNAGAYVGGVIGGIVLIALIIYALSTHRMRQIKKAEPAPTRRQRQRPRTWTMPNHGLQRPAPAHFSRGANNGISRLIRQATIRRNGSRRTGDDTQRLIYPSNQNRGTHSNNSPSLSEIDLDRHPSLASVYRKNVKCLTKRELNSMFPAVEYGELAYNMKLQNIDSSNIYTSRTNISEMATPAQVRDTLASSSSDEIEASPRLLFEAYPPVRPKCVDDENEPELQSAHDMSQYDNHVCIICQNDLMSTDTVRMLSCHHIFHDECVTPWIIDKNGTCPLCKRDLKSEVPATVVADQEAKIESKLKPKLSLLNVDIDTTSITFTPLHSPPLPST